MKVIIMAVGIVGIETGCKSSLFHNGYNHFLPMLTMLNKVKNYCISQAEYQNGETIESAVIRKKLEVRVTSMEGLLMQFVMKMKTADYLGIPSYDFSFWA